MTMNNIQSTTEKKPNYKITQRIAKSIFTAHLKNIHHGKITITDINGTITLGNQNSSLSADIDIINPKTFSLIVLKNDIGLGEAYAKGFFKTECITTLLYIFAINSSETDKLARIYDKTIHFITRIQNYYIKKNKKEGSKKNISSHYDIGNNLFETFLDTNMQYSSAVYDPQHTTLEEAQNNKMQLICQRLELNANDHILEIGSGWGGLAIYMAKKYGCRVTTITISEKQYAYSKSRIINEGLENSISIKLCDYRDIHGRFDKIVSVEMIEAVGRQYYQDYFDISSRVLKTSGLFLIQGILYDDHRYNSRYKDAHFINHYIFPGSQIPCLNILNKMANRAGFLLSSYNDITSSYVKTLAAWQKQFNQNAKKLDNLGYDKYFQRLWNFYFSYCQAGFSFQQIRNAHLIFKKREY